MGEGYRLLDVFSGCGGLTQGFVSTGAFVPVGAVENDRAAAASYASNFGQHIHVGDAASWHRGSLPLAEIVVAGPPCQGFSGLGRRDSHDVRNALWRVFAKVVQRVRPAFFVLENVPAFLASQEFAALRAETAPSGRLASWRLEAFVLQADRYGVAQARRRAIVIGRPTGMRMLGRPPEQADAPTLGSALGGLKRKVVRTDLPSRTSNILGSPIPGAYTSRELHVTVAQSAANAARIRAVPPGGARQDLPDALRFPAWRDDRAFTGAADVMGRLRWDRPAVTIRTEFFRPEKGRFLHPDEHRPLTHYEAALLQGFPPDYLWCGSKAAIARQIGNAVPVPLAGALAMHIRQHLR